MTEVPRRPGRARPHRHWTSAGVSTGFGVVRRAALPPAPSAALGTASMPAAAAASYCGLWTGSCVTAGSAWGLGHRVLLGCTCEGDLLRARRTGCRSDETSTSFNTCMPLPAQPCTIAHTTGASLPQVSARSGDSRSRRVLRNDRTSAWPRATPSESLGTHFWGTPPGDTLRPSSLRNSPLMPRPARTPTDGLRQPGCPVCLARPPRCRGHGCRRGPRAAPRTGRRTISVSTTPASAEPPLGPCADAEPESLCSALLCSAPLCSARLGSAPLRSAMPCFAPLCSARCSLLSALCSALLHCSLFAPDPRFRCGFSGSARPGAQGILLHNTTTAVVIIITRATLAPRRRHEHK